MARQVTTLEVSDRTVTGKKVAQLRRSGKIPAVIYDHGASDHVEVDAKLFEIAFRTVGRSQPLELVQNNKKHLAMIKLVDRHPVRHDFQHIAFHLVKRNEKVTAEVAIRLHLDEGNDQTPAERAGLVVLRALDSVVIKALPNNLPEELALNGEALQGAGDRLTLADITLPDGVEFADAEIDTEQVVANVYEPSVIEAANEAAAGDADAEEADGSDQIEDAVDAEHGSHTNETSNDAEGKPGGKRQHEQKGN